MAQSTPDLSLQSDGGTLTESSAEQVLDTKFITAALIIGIAYVAVIMLVYWTAGKESAGVAGVALTAIATAVFREFEKLRFKALAESQGTTVNVPSLSLPRIALICFAMAGASFLFSLAIGELVVILLAPAPLEKLELEDIFSLISDWRAFASIIGVKLLAFFFVGYLVPKGFRFSSYSDITIAALLAAVLPDLIQALPVVIKSPGDLPKATSLLLITAFWLAFVLAGIGGAWRGVRSSARQAAHA
jgi:hypothetical protein